MSRRRPWAHPLVYLGERSPSNFWVSQIADLAEPENGKNQALKANARCRKWCFFAIRYTWPTVCPAAVRGDSVRTPSLEGSRIRLRSCRIGGLQRAVRRIAQAVVDKRFTTTKGWRTNEKKFQNFLKSSGVLTCPLPRTPRSVKYI